MYKSKPEETLSRVICQFLRVRGVYFFHPANEGKRGWGAVRMFHNNGGVAGVADLVLLCPGGRCVFVELKAGKNTQEASQREFERQVRKRGFEYYIWRSVDDANQFCNQLVRESLHAKTTGIL